MKKNYLLTFTGVALSAIIAGCDVTSNDSFSGSQEGDPVVVDFPIAFIQRPVPVGFEDEDDVQMSILSEDIFDPTEFRPGAVLLFKERASVSAATRVVTEGAFPAAPSLPGEEPTEPLYDVRDLSVNAEGTKLVFSMRAPEDEDADEEEQPTWNIWEYDIEEDTLTRVIESDIIAEAGHDRFPVYLTDDSIVFSSTRQRTSKSLLLDQSRPQYAYVTERDDENRAFTLHRIDEDRLNIEQISFGKGHDLHPTVLDDGRILFVRGDDTSNTNQDRLSLYTMNPDGSNLSLHYGFHSPSGSDTDGQGALLKPLQMPDDKILVNFRPRQTTLFGGDIYALDTFNYIDITQPTSANLGASGPAEEPLSVGEVVLEAQSPHGYFNSAFPLFDGTGRLLVSWMPCLVQGFRPNIFVQRIDTDITDPDDDTIVIGVDTRYQLVNEDGELVDRSGDVLAAGEPAVEIPFEEITSLPCDADTFDNPNISPSEPQYGIWVYDPVTETQDLVEPGNEIGTMYTEAVVFQPRTQPTFIADAADEDDFTRELAAQNVGVLHIRSIYDVDGQDSTIDGIAAMADPLRTPADTRPVRFVRFLEEANMPHEDDYEIDTDLVEGRNNQPGKAIIGYAEVHPDGSIMTKVPANVAFTMEFLDADGHRVTGPLGIRHRNWINLRPGEVRTCNGCHTAASTQPHGRLDAEPESANPGALAEVQYPNTSLNDRFGTPYAPPQVGETMAEYFVRAKLADPGEAEDPLAPSVDLVYTDVWTDPASGATPGADISMEYGVVDPVTGLAGPDNLLTLPPVLIGECLTEWNFLCRIVIDYEDHIQPIFEVTRTIPINGVDTDTTCLSCHSPTDIDGNAQVPAPDVGNLQLDFSPVISNLDDDMVFLKGYDEFFADGDPLFVLDANGVLQPQLIQLVVNGVPQFETQQQRDPITDAPLFEFLDQNGQTACLPLDTNDPNFTLQVDGNGAPVPCLEFVLDANGERVPVLVPNTQGRYLSGQGANAGQNQRFFDAFAPGGAHDGYLTAAEIKLFAEWLDKGGQYYNEIFKALED